MSEPHIPDVNVDELMERVREIVRRRGAGEPAAAHAPDRCFEGFRAAASITPFPFSLESTPESPAFVRKMEGYQINDFLKYHDREFVKNAYLGILLREPDPGGFNHYLGEMRRGALTKVEVLGRMRYSQEGRRESVQVKGLLLPFLALSLCNIPVLGYLPRLIASIVQLPATLRSLQSFDARTQNQLLELTDHVKRVAGSFDSKFHEMEVNRSSIEDLRASKADRSEVESSIGELKVSKADRTELDAVAALAVKQDAVTELHGTLEEIRGQIREHKRSILDQQHRTAMLLEQAGEHFTEAAGADRIHSILAEKDHLLDAMYVSFEDQFRGTREDVKERQRIYLPFVERAGAGSNECPVLDVGCGRGEWLDLLKESGYVGMGVDQNRVMVRQCLELGHMAFEADAIEFLSRQNPNSLGAITGFHVVEHLPLKSLIALLDESMRALKPGGVVIFETPNPENLIVGASLFFRDPTHRNPLLPDTLTFIVEYRGFMGIQLLKLHRRGEPVFTNQEFVDEIIWRANMEQDYAVIGYKA